VGTCERCGRDFEAYCAKCREEIRKEIAERPEGKFLPLVFVEIDGDRFYYRFACYCRSCPCNDNGKCATRYTRLPISQLHEWDGDNIIKAWCG